ncbi:uncharacterized protein HMPREF1541_07167 [Cyphellophora europaea CBS 101466]|uniref:Plasma membrane proteolipid 3 n=1 Tax=Cyphellophora europaea (strain CBS 101466) TaxID=1220924 RepID=W2RMJ6_CYPE1|nr:uncharacterized protein HMPREF1541_07167 [Cyphellophora europaea CBS 101466]ETN37545.1 hypothetical protein HMPREF1541_07167 [Cyphellophora europaea CBS 101466]
MARIPLFKRLVIMMMNILFPPIAVAMITGVGMDTLVNSVLFLLAVIPSHIHGFYISWVYFNRKRKVRKGIYPGDKASGISSDRVNNGGATRREIQKLKEERDFGKVEKSTNRLSRPGVSRQLSNRVANWDDGFDKEMLSRTSSMNRPSTLSRHNSGRSGRRQENGTVPRSRSESRTRSLTRQLSNRLEDHMVRRLTDRDDRRRRRDYDYDDTGSYGASSEASPAAMAEVRRWR